MNLWELSYGKKKFRKEIQKMARQFNEDMQRNMNDIELQKDFINKVKLERISKPITEKEKYFFGEER